MAHHGRIQLRRRLGGLLAIALAAAGGAAAPAAATPGDLVDVQQLGSSAFDRGWGAAVDARGRSYVAGSTDGELPGSFDPHAGRSDAFVASYDEEGALRWVRQLGTPDFDDAFAVTADASDAVYVVGRTFRETLPGSPDPAAGGSDAFVASYAHGGSDRWVRQLGSTANDEALAVAVYGDRIYVTGFTRGRLPGSPQPNAGETDVFLAAYDTSGNRLWVRQLGSPERDIGQGVASDGFRVYVGGLTRGTLPGSPDAPAGDDDVFLAAFELDGTLAWVRQLGTADTDQGFGVEVGQRGEVYLAGSTQGTLPGSLQPSAGLRDAFLARFGSLSGSLAWVTQLGSASGESGRDVTVDRLGFVYLAGITRGTLPGSPQSNAGETDAFVAAFDAQADLAWVRQLGSAGFESGQEVAAGRHGEIVLVGGTSGTLPDSPDPQAGAEDAFVARYEGQAGDQDGDGLANVWETEGVDANGDGIIDLQLPGADPERKDIFVEVDWLSCALDDSCAPDDAPSHEPVPGALEAVVEAFANAPVSNPDGSTGITLHPLRSEGIPEGSLPSADPAFFYFGDGLPCSGFLGTPAQRADANCEAIQEAIRMTSHYGLFLHGGGGFGGFSYGSYFTVHPQGWVDAFGPDAVELAGGLEVAQSSVFMHELGHDLGLRHGGTDHTNCKPNYLSVMNYPLTTEAADPNRPLDYSREALPDLREDGLDESLGIQGPPGRLAIWGGAFGDPRGAPADGPLDFDDDGAIDGALVSANVNNVSPWSDCQSFVTGELLRGADDWSNLSFGFYSVFGGSGGFLSADGHGDMRAEEIVEAASTIDADADGFVNADDNCPGTANADQSDADQDGVGDACEEPFDFAGLFAPVANPPTVNEVKAGRTVPVKFSLGGDRGLDVFGVGFPASQEVLCESGAPTQAIEETTTAGGSGLSYDPALDQYVYAWKTEKAWSGTCRELVLRFADGSEHTALFFLR